MGYPVKKIVEVYVCEHPVTCVITVDLFLFPIKHNIPLIVNTGAAAAKGLTIDKGQRAHKGLLKGLQH